MEVSKRGSRKRRAEREPNGLKEGRRWDPRLPLGKPGVTTPPGRAGSPRTAACRGSRGPGRRLRRAGFASGPRRQLQQRQRSGRGFLARPYFRRPGNPLLLHWGVLGFVRPPPLHVNAFPVGGAGVGTCSKQAVALTSLWRGAGALLVAWWWRAVQKPPSTRE